MVSNYPIQENDKISVGKKMYTAKMSSEHSEHNKRNDEFDLFVCAFFSGWDFFFVQKNEQPQTIMPIMYMSFLMHNLTQKLTMHRMRALL